VLESDRVILRGVLFQQAGYFLLFLAIFSGRFTLDRLVGLDLEYPWLELRTLALLGSYAVYIMGRRMGALDNENNAFEGRGFLVLLGIFLAYATMNILLLGEREVRGAFFYDIFTVIATLYLVFKYSVSSQLLTGLAIVAEAIGGTLFLLAAVGVGNPDLNGHAWAPIAGPITFYRIEGFAFFSAMYLAWMTDRTGMKFVHYAFAGICLFATLASLSKGALVGLLVSLSLMAFYWVVLSNYRSLVRLVLLITIVGTTFFFTKGWVMSSRIQAGLDMDKVGGISMSAGLSRESRPTGSNDPDDLEIGRYQKSMLLGSLLEKYSRQVELEDFTEEELERLDALWVVFEDYGAPDYKINPEGFIRWVNSLIVLGDGSSRLQMAQVAINQFLQHKLFGAGPGSYRFISLGSGSGKIEVYTYPHNIVLETASVMGLSGIVLFVLAVCAGLVVVVRKLFVNKYALFWLGYISFFTVTALFSGDFYDFRIYWFVVLLVAFMPANHRSHMASRVSS
jgi:hypothetical protein